MNTITLQLTDNEVQSLLNALYLASKQMEDSDGEKDLNNIALNISNQKRQQDLTSFDKQFTEWNGDSNGSVGCD